MKSFKINASNIFFFVLLMVFALSTLVFADEKFFISKDKGASGKAVVDSSKEFTVKFEPPLASKVDDYKTEGSTFFLTVDACKMDIKAKKEQGRDGEVVRLDIKDLISGASRIIDNPTGFKVSASSGVEFDETKPICESNVKFESNSADANKFLVEISLDGNFPASLGLKSEDAQLYDDLAKDSNKEILPVWAWVVIGLVGGILFLILLIVGIVVLVCTKCRKKKTTQFDPTLQTAIEKAKPKKHISAEESKKEDHSKQHSSESKRDKQKSVEESAKPKKVKAKKVSKTQEHVTVKPEKGQKQALLKESKISSQSQQPSVVKNPTSEPLKNPPQRNNRIYMRPSVDDEPLSSDSDKDKAKKKPLPRDRLYMRPSVDDDPLSSDSDKAKAKKPPPKVKRLYMRPSAENPLSTEDDKAKAKKPKKLKTVVTQEETMKTQ